MSDAPYKYPNPSAGPGPGRGLAETLASLPALDVSVFDDLQECLQWGREPLHRLCTSFVSSVENLLRLLSDGVGIDRRELAKHLHALLGSSGMIGAYQVRYLVGQLKSAVESGRQEEIPEVIALLMQAMRPFKHEFESRLETIPPGGVTRQPP